MVPPEEMPPLPTGQQLRDEGIEKAYKRIPLAWELEFDLLIAHYGHTGELFTAEHVRRKIGMPPSGPNGLGAAFHVAKHAGRIIQVGWQQNTVPSAHSRHVRVYRTARKGEIP